MDLIQRWQALTDELGSAEVKLLAVSKYAPDAAVQVLIDAGQQDFGESRPQNLRDRAKRWPECRWHMIGPVQKNKAKYIGRYASMWHSCEDLDTAKAVARYVEGRVLPILIQVNITDIDSTKRHGIQPAALPDFVQALVQVEGLQVVGVMGMAAKDADAAQAFRDLRSLRDSMLDGISAELESLELCIGMSGDYRLAVAEGSTMVRLGSILFDEDKHKGE